MRELPPDYKDEILSVVRQEFVKSGRTLVVLDDDPTGTQTCYDVTVLMSWDVELISEELKKGPDILFILTNSRSLTEDEAVRRTVEIGRHLKTAVRESGREIVVISRSDSMLRGHFPAEVGAIATALDMKDFVTVLVPAFIEGGRYTIDDVHYIAEHGGLIPVSDTPFARDVVFGYKNADLKKWVEEKTHGRVEASAVISVSLEEVRVGGPQVVCNKLKNCTAGSICIVNAASYRDLEVFAMGAMWAEKAGKEFLYRTSATFVPIRAGLLSGKTFTPKKVELISAHGSLVVVGSHVPKTTSQLTWLLAHGLYKSLEVDVKAILNSIEPLTQSAAIVQQTDRWLASGNDVVIHTSRTLEVGHDSESSLRINAVISDFLVRIIKGLSVRPKMILAKGGITSSDVATKGLSAEKAKILGAIIPGVPVWEMDQKSKFPGIHFVVFPGNVGNEAALVEVLDLFR